jgi:hypothetical protein
MRQQPMMDLCVVDVRSVHAPLVGEVLGRGEGQTRRDDTLDGRVVGKVQEQRRPLSWLQAYDEPQVSSQTW